MSCNFLDTEFDSIFETETNDDALLPSKFWSNDNFSMESTEINFDTFLCDDLPIIPYDSANDKSKDKLLDFEYNILDYNETDTAKNPIKLEPTHTNSVSSSYLTDDASPNSSHHNSPIGRKVRKREFQAVDSSSEKSFALYEEPMEHAPKSAKVEIIKKETFPTNTRTIYKVSRDAKLEPREPYVINNLPGQRSIVKVRQAGGPPYIVSSSVKSVSISKYPQDKFYDTNVPSRNTGNNYLSSSNHNQYSPEQECDLLTGDYYDHEVDLCSDYKPRMTSYINHNVFSNTNPQHNTGSAGLFQTPIPQSGPLYLTEEEKRTLLQENYPIPTRVPLTKQEERNLKKVRRKIKNKLSAQESRRKKKEYVDALEKKVEAYELERMENKRRIETLENQQRTLQNQIRHYQSQMMNKITGTGNTTSTGLMLFMICFALILVGGSVPSSYRKMNLPQSSLISSSSLYYMGYGPSRPVFNDSQGVFINDGHSPHDKPHLSPDTDLRRHVDIIPRQSILLGEDNDDRNFEELVLSYRKSDKKKICGSVNRINNMLNVAKNGSIMGDPNQANIIDDIIVARMASIHHLVK